MGILIFGLMAFAPSNKEKEQAKFKRLYRKLVLNRQFVSPEQWGTQEPNYSRIKLAVGQRKLLKDKDQIIQIKESVSHEKTANQIPTA
ncbi:MAG TPA: hypothetical protein VD998_02995 [Verrucomicrobiae bacterium]|nr:hypothetical protein [Verrucomicrobiae bacterium]